MCSQRSETHIQYQCCNATLKSKNAASFYDIFFIKSTHSDAKRRNTSPHESNRNLIFHTRQNIRCGFYLFTMLNESTKFHVSYHFTLPFSTRKQFAKSSRSGNCGIRMRMSGPKLKK